MIFDENFEEYMERKIPGYNELLSMEQIDVLNKLFLQVAKWLSLEIKISKTNLPAEEKKYYYKLREDAQKRLEEKITKIKIENNLMVNYGNRSR